MTMKLRDIALCNLKRRKAKATFVMLGLVIGVTAVVAFISLVEALTNDINHKLEKYGANILIVPKTENLSLTYGGLSVGGVSFEMREIKQEELARLKSIKNAGNVAAVGPMVLGPVKIQGHDVLLAGMELGVAPLLRPWWRIRGDAPGEGALLLGAEAARVLGLDVGAKVELNGRELPVTGVLETTGSQDDQIVFAPLRTAQSLLGKEGRISMAEVAALCSGCPIDDMVKQISAILPEANVMAIKQVVKSRMEALAHFQKVAYVLSTLVMLVGGLVVLVTMMGSVRERTSEFGIFRAIGFQRRHVIWIVLFEAGVISLLSGVLGYMMGLGATKLALPFFAESHDIMLPFNPVLGGAVLILALILGLASSAYPALMAARLDPNDALRTL
jgi:putative ABC transport system permease protein